jgi:hypothetical protein
MVKNMKSTINSGEIFLFNYADWGTRDPWQYEPLRISLIWAIWLLKFLDAYLLCSILGCCVLLDLSPEMWEEESRDCWDPETSAVKVGQSYVFLEMYPEQNSRIWYDFGGTGESQFVKKICLSPFKPMDQYRLCWNLLTNWEWWLCLPSQLLRRLRQEDLMFKSSLGNRVRPCLKEETL